MTAAWVTVLHQKLLSVRPHETFWTLLLREHRSFWYKPRIFVHSRGWHPQVEITYGPTKSFTWYKSLPVLIRAEQAVTSFPEHKPKSNCQSLKSIVHVMYLCIYELNNYSTTDDFIGNFPMVKIPLVTAARPAEYFHSAALTMQYIGTVLLRRRYLQSRRCLLASKIFCSVLQCMNNTMEIIWWFHEKCSCCPRLLQISTCPCRELIITTQSCKTTYRGSKLEHL